MTVLIDRGRTWKGNRESGVVVTRRFLCQPYSDAPLAILQMLGGVNFVGGRLIRTLPARDPVFPWCFCTDISCDDGEGVYGVTTGGVFVNSPANLTPAQALALPTGFSGGANLVCTFKNLEQPRQQEDDSANQKSDDQKETDLAEESWDFTGQQLTLPNKFFRWQGVVQPLFNSQVQATKTVPRIDFSLTRHLCVRKPTLTMAKLYGTINKSAFRVGFDIWPPETLRFDGAHVSHKITSQGVKHFELAYRFAINPVYDTVVGGGKDFTGWNRFFDPARNLWDYVTLVGDPTRFAYLKDEDTVTQTIGGVAVAGFRLLFHPAAV